jgi:uncharacterized membrane protein YqiK
VSRVRRLSLALRESEITEECITNQGIRLRVRAVAAFKVGDDPASIANAARRFLSEQDRTGGRPRHRAVPRQDRLAAPRPWAPSAPAAPDRRGGGLTPE